MSAARPGTSLSPRELGQALHVSESSVKRWIDAGRLPARVTSGGHRRIELLPALRFIRGSGRALVDPAPLGVTAELCEAARDPALLEARLFEHLRLGRGDALERELPALLALGLIELVDLLDGPLRGAMRRVGELWHGGHEGVAVEHRATGLVMRALDAVAGQNELTRGAPTAVGGSLARDPGTIGSRMAATILRREGFDAVDLGADTPLDALLETAERLDARLVWLSVGWVTDARRQSAELERFLDTLDERDTTCILGGRQVQLLRLPAETRIGRDMGALALLAAHVRRGGRA